MKASLKKKVIVTVVALLGLSILTSPLREKGPQYTTEHVTRSTVTDVVSESGNVASSGRFDVYSSSTGYIEEVYVQNGDTVDRGTNLFKVRSTATPQEQATAYANYQNAINAQNTAVQNKLSYQALLGKDRQAVLDAQNTVDYKNANTTNPATKKDYTDLEKLSIDAALDNARETFTADEKKYTQADAAIAAAAASVNSTGLAYQATQDMIVTAPAPGTVANFTASVGDKVAAMSAGPSLASAATSSSPALVILGDISRTTIRIPLNEVDVDKVKLGEIASVTFDAFREKNYKGHISAIDTAGTNTNGVITYNATVTIDTPDPNIKTEMTATVTIETARHANVLTVPNSAVKPYKGGKAVIALGVSKNAQVKNKAGKQLPLHYIPVKVGLKGISRTEITEGVSQGTQVVTSSIN